MKDDSNRLKNLLVALAILILAVFAFVGYNSLSAKKQADSDAVTSTAEGPNSVAQAPATKIPSSSTPFSSEETTASGSPTSGGMVPPTSDSIKPDPPNGMTFGGSGHYQLYRQGNLTWRLDTETGQTCIVFATEEEWRKPQVFRTGCRGR